MSLHLIVCCRRMTKERARDALNLNLLTQLSAQQDAQRKIIACLGAIKKNYFKNFLSDARKISLHISQVYTRRLNSE